MQGWYAKSHMGTASKGAHWIAFLVLVGCTLFLMRDSWKAKGPRGKERWYAGYHEEYNISLLVNMFAMIAYFGKIVSDTLGHNYVNVGPFILGLGNYRYADYMLTCPLLAYDLLSQVRGPYKMTGGAVIFAVLMTGAVANFYPGDELRAGAIAWFVFGCVLYCGAYALFITVVRAQYERLMALAQGTEAKKALLPLRLAVYTFFTIWIVFPLVWILGTQGLGLISDEVQEVLHCLCDIVAKSFYGFALARYRSYFDKKLFKLLEELGFDGEEELQNLEKDLKEIHGVSSQIGYASGAMDRKNSFNQPGPPLGGRLSGEIQRRRSMEFTPLGGQGGQPISLMEGNSVSASRARAKGGLSPFALKILPETPAHGTPATGPVGGGLAKALLAGTPASSNSSSQSREHNESRQQVMQYKAMMELLQQQIRTLESQEQEQDEAHKVPKMKTLSSYDADDFSAMGFTSPRRVLSSPGSASRTASQAPRMAVDQEMDGMNFTLHGRDQQPPPRRNLGRSSSDRGMEYQLHDTDPDVRGLC